MVFDHELAFSFVRDIFPSPEPWKLDRQRYLVEHVFYSGLKSQQIDLEGFTSNLLSLSDIALDELFEGMPPEWNNGNGPKISQHLLAVRDHAEEFAEEIRRFLA
jgi:hypothetical protein